MAEGGESLSFRDNPFLRANQARTARAPDQPAGGDPARGEAQSSGTSSAGDLSQPPAVSSGTSSAPKNSPTISEAVLGNKDEAAASPAFRDNPFLKKNAAAKASTAKASTAAESQVTSAERATATELPSSGSEAGPSPDSESPEKRSSFRDNPFLKRNSASKASPQRVPDGVTAAQSTSVSTAETTRSSEERVAGEAGREPDVPLNDSDADGRLPSTDVTLEPVDPLVVSLSANGVGGGGDTAVSPESINSAKPEDCSSEPTSPPAVSEAVASPAFRDNPFLKKNAAAKASTAKASTTAESQVTSAEKAATELPSSGSEAGPSLDSESLEKRSSFRDNPFLKRNSASKAAPQRVPDGVTAARSTSVSTAETTRSSEERVAGEAGDANSVHHTLPLVPAVASGHNDESHPLTLSQSNSEETSPAIRVSTELEMQIEDGRKAANTEESANSIAHKVSEDSSSVKSSGEKRTSFGSNASDDSEIFVPSPPIMPEVPTKGWIQVAENAEQRGKHADIVSGLDCNDSDVIPPGIVGGNQLLKQNQQNVVSPLSPILCTSKKEDPVTSTEDLTRELHDLEVAEKTRQEAYLSRESELIAALRKAEEALAAWREQDVQHQRQYREKRQHLQIRLESLVSQTRVEETSSENNAAAAVAEASGLGKDVESSRMSAISSASLSMKGNEITHVKSEGRVASSIRNNPFLQRNAEKMSAGNRESIDLKNDGVTKGESFRGRAVSDMGLRKAQGSAEGAVPSRSDSGLEPHEARARGLTAPSLKNVGPERKSSASLNPTTSSVPISDRSDEGGETAKLTALGVPNEQILNRRRLREDDSGVVEKVKLSSHPVYSKYLNMLHEGQSPNAVRKAVEGDNINPFFLEMSEGAMVDSRVSVKLNAPLFDHPLYSKFFKLLNDGVSQEEVADIMKAQGLDRSHAFRSPFEKESYFVSVPASMAARFAPFKLRKREQRVESRRLHWQPSKKVAMNSVWNEEDDDDIVIDNAEFESLFRKCDT